MKNEKLKELVCNKFKSLSNNKVEVVITEVFTKIKSDYFPSDLDNILCMYFKKENFGYTSNKKNEKTNISDNVLFNTILEDWIGEQLDLTLEKYREIYIKSSIRKDEIDLFYKKYGLSQVAAAF